MTKQEILIKHLAIMLEDPNNNFYSVEEMVKQPGFKTALDAMEEYAKKELAKQGL